MNFKVSFNNSQYNITCKVGDNLTQQIQKQCGIDATKLASNVPLCIPINLLKTDQIRLQQVKSVSSKQLNKYYDKFVTANPSIDILSNTDYQLEKDLPFLKSVADQLKIQQCYPEIQPEFICESCDVRCCGKCFQESEHQTHVWRITDVPAIICKCQRNEIDIDSLNSEIFGLGELLLKQLVFVCMQFATKLHNKYFTEKRRKLYDNLYDIIVTRHSICYIIYVLSVSPTSYTIQQLIEQIYLLNVNNPHEAINYNKMLQNDSLIKRAHTIKQTESVNGYYKNTLSRVAQFRALIIPLIGLNFQDHFVCETKPDGSAVVACLSALQRYEEHYSQMQIKECKVIQKLFSYLTLNLKQFREDEISTTQDLILAILDLAKFGSEFTKPHLTTVLEVEPTQILVVQDFLFVCMMQYSLDPNTEYENTGVFDQKVDMSLFFYQSVFMPFFVWFLKGLKNQNFDTEMQQQLVKNAVIHSICHLVKNVNELIQPIIDKKLFTMDCNIITISMSVRISEKEGLGISLKETINVAATQLQVSETEVIRAIITSPVCWLLNITKICNGETVAMNKIDWDDLCIEAYKDVESNIFQTEMITCLRKFLKIYPEEVCKVIREQIVHLNISETSQLDFFTQLAFTPDFDITTEFLKKMLMTVDDIKPSLDKYANSIITAFFPLRTIHEVLLDQIKTNETEVRSHKFVFKDSGNFEPSLALMKVDEICERFGNEQRSTFLPPSITDINAEYQAVLLHFSEECTKIALNELEAYCREERSYPKALHAIRILRNLNIKIVREKPFRHTVLNQFISNELQQITTSQKPKIDLKDRLSKIKAQNDNDAKSKSKKALMVPPSNIIVSDEQRCAVCHEDMNQQDVTLPVCKAKATFRGQSQIFDFCVHGMHQDCCKTLKECPICKFAFTETASVKNTDQLMEIGASIFENIVLFAKGTDKALAIPLLQKRFEQLLFLQRQVGVELDVENLRQSLEFNTQPLLFFPPTTLDAFLYTYGHNCSKCKKQLDLGRDFSCVFICLSCGQCCCEHCEDEDINSICSCGFKVLLSVSDNVVVANGSFYQAPYLNQFGQVVHTAFAEQQFLSEKRSILLFYDIVFGRRGEQNLTGAQFALMKGEEAMRDDESEYVEDAMDGGEENEEEEELELEREYS